MKAARTWRGVRQAGRWLFCNSLSRVAAHLPLYDGSGCGYAHALGKKTCLKDLLAAKNFCMKKFPLLLIYTVLFAVVSPSQVFASDKSIGLTTTELKSALKNKTKSEVKEFFGRKPDRVLGENIWYYQANYLDPDSEATMTECSVSFFSSDYAPAPNTVSNVSFDN